MTLVARDARAEDYPAFARLFLELKVPDPTPSAEQFDARIRPSTFFLFEGERPIAYSFWQALGEVARVIHVVVDPTAQGRGVGRALLREVGTRGMRAGCSRWTLHVKPDNVPARRLYERCGMRVVARSRSMEIAWSEVERLPLGESEGETEAFHVRPEEEAQVEGAAGLLAGQIGALRKGGGWVFLGLRRGDGDRRVRGIRPELPWRDAVRRAAPMAHAEAPRGDAPARAGEARGGAISGDERRGVGGSGGGGGEGDSRDAPNGGTDHRLGDLGGACAHHAA